MICRKKVIFHDKFGKEVTQATVGAEPFTKSHISKIKNADFMWLNGSDRTFFGFSLKSMEIQLRELWKIKKFLYITDRYEGQRDEARRMRKSTIESEYFNYSKIFREEMAQREVKGKPYPGYRLRSAIFHLYEHMSGEDMVRMNQQADIVEKFNRGEMVVQESAPLKPRNENKAKRDQRLLEYFQAFDGQFAEIDRKVSKLKNKNLLKRREKQDFMLEQHKNFVKTMLKVLSSIPNDRYTEQNFKNVLMEKNMQEYIKRQEKEFYPDLFRDRGFKRVVDLDRLLKAGSTVDLMHEIQDELAEEYGDTEWLELTRLKESIHDRTPYEVSVEIWKRWGKEYNFGWFKRLIKDIRWLLYDLKILAKDKLLKKYIFSKRKFRQWKRRGFLGTPPVKKSERSNFFMYFWYNDSDNDPSDIYFEQTEYKRIITTYHGAKIDYARRFLWKRESE